MSKMFSILNIQHFNNKNNQGARALEKFLQVLNLRLFYSPSFFPFLQVNHVSFSPNGQIMATCGEDMTIFLFQTPAGQPAKTRGGAGGKEEVGFEPIGWIELDFIPLALSWKSDSTRFLLAGAVESVVEVRVGGRVEEGKRGRM